jgi:cyclase
MLAKRIIPCLDIRDGKVVKGVNFKGIKEVGDPVELASEYNHQKADELVFYDITASYENRSLFLDLVKKVSEKVFIPLTVGGGISSIEKIRDSLRSGADKVSLNSPAVKNPDLIRESSEIFGSQCIVIGIDAKRDSNGNFKVYINGGRTDTGIDLIYWAKKVEELGAGEICLNSMDADGTKSGFDIEMTKAVCDAVKIPVIASGGAGKIDDFSDVLKNTGATAALAASLFHYGELTVDEIKRDLSSKNILVRK